ncbi:MAG: hypothetical protein H6698_02375 [Myxococcales bacterium]|nr:hypothetical protein [Myxococcales bacterium]
MRRPDLLVASRTAFAFAALALVACGTDSGSAPDAGVDATTDTAPDARTFENCFNDIDDNGDLLVDCADPQCRVLQSCRTYQCPDGDLGGRVGSAIFDGSTRDTNNDLAGTCGGAGGVELAFTWTAPETRDYLVDTRGDSYDTVVYVREGGCDGPELACNDDATEAPGPALQSEVRIEATAGATYLIVIDGYDVVLGDDGGDFVLNITPAQTEDETGFCGDGRDNDADGAVDCQDADCGDDPACAPLDGVLAISSGGAHTCALRAASELVCWGSGSRGQLGDGQSANRARPVSVDIAAVAVGAGPSATCAVSDDGGVWCWGAGDYSVISQDWTDVREPLAMDVEGTAAKVAIGYSHACALRDDGRVECWGQSDSGQLGDGVSGGGRRGPVFAALDGATDVCVAASFSCALDDEGAVFCWGYNGAGQLGNSSFDNATTPRRVEIDPAVRIACAQGNACAILESGALMCWGQNWSGQVGDGGSSSRALPTQVSLGGSKAVDVAVGANHACAATQGGEVWCWGGGWSGQLGRPDAGSNLRPARVDGVDGAVAVSAGSEHSCAVTSAGEVLCWGSNSTAQLGDQTRVGRATPGRVLAPRQD